MEQGTSTTPTPRSPLWTASTWPVIVALLVVQLFIAFEAVSLSTVLPVITADLDARTWYSLAYAATLTTALIGMIVGGNWADRSGVTVPLVIGGVLFVGGVVVTAVAPTIGVFVLGRAVQGLGGGIDSVLLYVVVGKVIPETARARMFGLLTAMWVVPSMVGPLGAGAFIEVAHWRWLFVAVAVLSCAGLVTLLLTTRDLARLSKGSLGKVMGSRGWWAFAAACALLVVHIGTGQPALASIVWLSIGVTALLIAATRLLPAGTLRGVYGAPRLVALRGVLGAAVAATDVYIPLYLQAERGVSPALAGFLVAIGAVGWATGAALQGRLEAKAAPSTLLRCGFILVLLGPVGATMVIATGAPIGIFAASSIAMGAGMGMAYPVITSTTLQLARPDEYGFYGSSLQAGESIATSAFLAATGMTLASITTNSYTITYLIITGVAVLAGSLGWRAVHQPHRGQTGQAS